MFEPYARLDALLRRDPGGRGFSANAPAADMEALANAFAAAKNILIISGFPILGRDGRISCETDGPIGAAHIACAFCDAGKNVFIATDKLCYAQLAAAAELRAPAATPILLDNNSAKLFELEIDTVISIERPGKAADGHCRTASAKEIDNRLTADTDAIFAALHSRGAVTIAVGDGGNELGMGKLAGLTKRLVENGELIAAVQPADITLTSGVSNWWGWGFAALASLALGRNILPTAEDEAALLDAVLAAGAVDGITKLPSKSVDSIPLADHIALLEAMNDIIKSTLG